MYGYIYKTTNLLNNKIYIGQHKAINDEFDKKYFGSGKILLESIDKYGIDNFKCEVIEWCETFDQLNEREIYWIDKLNSRDSNIGYNITTCGQGVPGLYGELNPNYGKTFSHEYRQHLREAHIGIQAGENHPMYGKHHSQMTKNLISEKLSGENHPNYGKHLSEETKLKISQANKENPNMSMLGKHHRDDSKQKISESKSIQVINLDTKEIFKSAKEASQKCTAYRSGICNCCKGKSRTCGGYHWAYYTNDIDISKLVDNSMTRKVMPKFGKVIDLDANIIYKSVSDASNKTGTVQSSIYRCCKGERKTAGKHRWAIYKED